MSTVRGQSFSIPIQSLAPAALLLLVSGCAVPGMQEDFSAYGASPIAKQTRVYTYAGDLATIEMNIASWVGDQCPNSNLVEFRTCASALGLHCADASPGQSLPCTFNGMYRRRQVSFIASPSYPQSAREWQSHAVTISVLLQDRVITAKFSDIPVGTAKQP